MSADDLRERLPAALAARIASAQQRAAALTVVVEGSGLDAVQRGQAERAIRDASEEMQGVREVRVAFMAEKPARRIIAVGSGKGGVGKSTVAANLAVALARGGAKVGLVDADIYGPSLARLTGTEDAKPTAHEDKTLVPVTSEWGLPVLSMAHLVSPDKALAWRGPMATSALGQLVGADWGDAEILVVDLPPGTGDVQITMIQKFKPAGAVIVSTPQDLALIDARRAVALFEQVEVPVIGLVENMAGYLCPHCGEASDPFGAGGAEAAAREMGLPFLARIPLDATIRERSDAGTPVAAGEGPQAEAFAALAQKVGAWVAAR